MAPAVLIADNDSAVSALLTEVLVRRGLTVWHAFDGETARQKAREPAVGVLVCDLDMPRASGLEVLESLRDLVRPPLTVVVSGYLDTALQERLRALPHVREVLRKPFDLLAFAARVNQLVGSLGAREQALEADSGAQACEH
jgi:CheY-like chemotaxis protein